MVNFPNRLDAGTHSHPGIHAPLTQDSRNSTVHALQRPTESRRMHQPTCNPASSWLDSDEDEDDEDEDDPLMAEKCSLRAQRLG